VKIAILTTQVPFTYGCTESLAHSLKEKLSEYGHAVEVIKIPFKSYPAQSIVEHMLLAKLLRVRNTDRVIALKFPAYYVKHDSKVVWLLHQFQQAYDLWGTPYQEIPNTPEGMKIRETVITADEISLKEGKRIYTSSEVVSDSLRRFHTLESEILYPPLGHPQNYRCGDFGDYILYPGSITAANRQHLAIESMKYVTTDVRLVLAGNPENLSELRRLHAMIDANGLSSRVQLICRRIEQREKGELFANALACLYIPYNNDWYGYATLESFQSKKPVITCRDSGGVLELVEDGHSGFVMPAEARPLAEAMDRLMENRAQASKMGVVGHNKMLSMEISWDRVVECLTR
jgi:glycosyltransferase involved in cell wall biosynthesis